MNELDMSRPGTELFPESNYNYSSPDENLGHAVDDPLNTGAKQSYDDADHGMSGQQQNFRALREEISKMKEEREYWKGQAEAYSNSQPSQSEPSQEDAYTALDWDDSRDVQKAFNVVRQENIKLRHEIKDALTAIETKTQRQDWNSMVTQHVPELTNKNPIFAEMIKNASNPYEAAYLLAELNARSKQPAPTQATPDYTNGQRALQNAAKPMSPSSVGGSGKLSSADYYASMSDEDFMKIASKNMANI